MDIGADTVLVSYVSTLVGYGLVYWLFSHFWGEYILTTFHELWGDGQVHVAGLGKVWFIFVWAAALPLIAIVTGQRFSSRYSKGTLVTKGLWISICAGFFEEIIYRGLVFMNAMFTLFVFNKLTFGLVRWIYEDGLVSLADWSTFGILHEQLTGHPNWVFGAAIVAATVTFRDEHQYLGFIGWVNSWFIGMVMFYLVFEYGMVTAIVAHFAYDAIVFTLRAFASKQEDDDWSQLFDRFIAGR
jgi:hypothetical protein